ncbi:MAG: AAA family ATPase [Moraxella sp.]|nr:AAA family ATPase [Moraxella sp.]
MSKRIVFFNHKGGVSKTTTVYNLGWKLSEDSRVLVVDADPQCNLTSLILKDNFDSYYANDETRKHNIKDGVSPAFSGRPVPIEVVDCANPTRNNSLFLLAGHGNLSEYDASLTFAQTSSNALTTLQNLPGSFNRLIELCEEKYNIDYTLIDLNPGLSSINQNLFLNSDYFILPTNPDPFSIMAIETLSLVLPRWGAWKNSSVETFSDSAYPLRNGFPKFLGVLIQRFNIRNGKAARPYQDNINEIKEVVKEKLIPKLQSADMLAESLLLGDYCLGEIPDFGGLLPKAIDAGVPVYKLEKSDIGYTGAALKGMLEKAQSIDELFSVVSDLIIRVSADD